MRILLLIALGILMSGCTTTAAMRRYGEQRYQAGVEDGLVPWHMAYVACEAKLEHRK